MGAGSRVRRYSTGPECGVRRTQSAAGFSKSAASTRARYSYRVYLSHAIVLSPSLVAFMQAPLAPRIAASPLFPAESSILLYRSVEDPAIGAGVRLRPV